MMQPQYRDPTMANIPSYSQYDDPMLGSGMLPEGGGQYSYPTGHYDAQQLKFLLDPQNIIKEVEMALKAMKPSDDDPNKWVKVNRDAKPFMNDVGISKTLTMLRPRVTTIFSLSEFNEDEIRWIMLDLSADLACLFLEKGEEFELDEACSDSVVDLICDCVYATLKKAMHGRWIDVIADTTRFSESSLSRPNMPQGGSSGLLGDLWRKVTQRGAY